MELSKAGCQLKETDKGDTWCTLAGQARNIITTTLVNELCHISMVENARPIVIQLASVKGLGRSTKKVNIVFPFYLNKDEKFLLSTWLTADHNHITVTVNCFSLEYFWKSILAYWFLSIFINFFFLWSHHCYFDYHFVRQNLQKTVTWSLYM